MATPIEERRAREREHLVSLGKIVLREVGEELTRKAYGTTDPEWVGRYALQYGDITPNGNLT